MSEPVADWMIGDGRAQLWLGDCLQRLRGLEDCTVDAVVTDPPYGLAFMGRKWDYDVPSVDIWREVMRVMRPGAHLLAFAGTRTHHRMACAIEDAGFEIRDMIAWVYGSGFPKSHNLHGEWEGWGTALKPALEPITLARKPLAGTVAQNVLAHGTGGLNVDGCRVPGEAWKSHYSTGLASVKYFTDGNAPVIEKAPHDSGRWPANLIHDGGDEATGLLGGAARFFYSPKASKADRDEGCEGEERAAAAMQGNLIPGQSLAIPGKPIHTPQRRNHHPTVKPTDLMRYLCRLITPPGGLVLDPFAGSGSTGKAAMLEGFRFLGVEREIEYLKIARDRIAYAFQLAGEVAQ